MARRCRFHSAPARSAAGWRHPTLLTAYGAYGISLAAAFDVGVLPWLNRGGIIAIAHVKDDSVYPAVLLETGANDPRVTSWMLTKMTARLQAANLAAHGPNPILLRVDFDAGHGIGSDRDQALRLRADEYTFLGWRLGLTGFDARLP